MRSPVMGEPVPFAHYWRGRFSTHLAGIIGGVIWGIGMSLNIIASGRAGFAISYGLGQGATMIAALWRPVGWVVVLYFAGLQGVLHAHYHAARIDRAGAWSQSTHVTPPTRRPTTSSTMCKSRPNCSEAARSTVSSSKGRPISCRPSGRPR